MFSFVRLTYPTCTRRDAAMINDAKLQQQRASFSRSFAHIDNPLTINVDRYAHEDCRFAIITDTSLPPFDDAGNIILYLATHGMLLAA